MSKDTFRNQLSDYILSGHAFLNVPTSETTRFLSELKSLAETLSGDGRQLFTWSQAMGWRDAEDNPVQLPSGVQSGQADPRSAPQQIVELPEESIFVLKDFGCYVEHKTYGYADVVIAWLAEIRDVLAATGRTVIFVGVDFEIPPPLAHEITTVEFKLPDDPAIDKAVRFVADGHKVDEQSMPAVVAACRGMTQQQVEDRTALALRKFKTLNADAW